MALGFGDIQGGGHFLGHVSVRITAEAFDQERHDFESTVSCCPMDRLFAASVRLVDRDLAVACQKANEVCVAGQTSIMQRSRT